MNFPEKLRTRLSQPKKTPKKSLFLFFSRILIKEGATVGLANGILMADGEKIYSAENLKVGLFK